MNLRIDWVMSRFQSTHTLLSVFAFICHCWMAVLRQQYQPCYKTHQLLGDVVQQTAAAVCLGCTFRAEIDAQSRASLDSRSPHEAVLGHHPQGMYQLVGYAVHCGVVPSFWSGLLGSESSEKGRGCVYHSEQGHSQPASPYI